MDRKNVINEEKNQLSLYFISGILREDSAEQKFDTGASVSKRTSQLVSQPGFCMLGALRTRFFLFFIITQHYNFGAP